MYFRTSSCKDVMLLGVSLVAAFFVGSTEDLVWVPELEPPLTGSFTI